MRRERVAYMVATTAALNKPKRVSQSSNVILSNKLTSNKSRASSLIPDEFARSALTAAIGYTMRTGAVISATAISMTMLASMTAHAQSSDIMRQDCEGSNGNHRVDCAAEQALPTGSDGAAAVPSLSSASSKSQDPSSQSIASRRASQVADEQVALADTSDEALLNQALDALHLKKAVENGTIDPAVLEQYQQETLKQRGAVNSAAKNNLANNSPSTSTSATTANPSQTTGQLVTPATENGNEIISDLRNSVLFI